MTERLIVVGRSGSGKSYMLDCLTKAEQWDYIVWVDTQDSYPGAIQAKDFNAKLLRKKKTLYIRVDKEFSMDDFYSNFMDAVKELRGNKFKDDVLLVVEETGMWVTHMNSSVQFFNDAMVRSRRYHSVAMVFHHIRQVPATPAGSATKWIIFPLAWNNQDKGYVNEHLPEISELIEELHKPENEYHFILFDVKTRSAMLMSPVGISDKEEEEPEEIVDEDEKEE